MIAMMSEPLAGQPQAPSLIGEILDGRYRITRKLGEGGMGEVFAAEHVHIEKRFAVKLLRQEIVSNPEAVQRFRQEARSSSSIGHRNIIAIEDFGQLPDGRIYMCMELLNGAALNDLITTPQPVERLMNIMIQTGHGLAAAHAKGIVHRDMKPENIFVTIDAQNQDVPKILDFGIAKVAGNEGQNNLTRTGTIFGTPFYMAPEQALGNPVDARTDIYAMGVIAYELFTGSLPFQGESFMGILTQHITTDAEPATARAAKVGRTLPPGLADIITCCMQKNPAQRFATMDDLVNALIGVYRNVAGAGMSTYMEAFPVSARMPAPTPPPLTAGYQAVGQGGHQHPTGRAGYAPPHPTGPAGYPPPYQTGPQPQPGYQGSGPTGPVPASPSQSGGYDPSGSMVAPRKSKAGLWIAILVVLLVGAGVTVMVLKGRGGSKTVAGGVGSDVASGAASGSAGSAVAIGSGGSGAAGLGAGSGSAAVVLATPDADSGSGSGSALTVALAPDAPDATSADAAPPPVVAVSVLVKASVTKYEIWENNELLGAGAQLIEVIPGHPHTLVIKSKGYKDAELVVDGTVKQPMATLEKLPSTTTHSPQAVDCKKASAPCHASYCAAHAGELECME